MIGPIGESKMPPRLVDFLTHSRRQTPIFKSGLLEKARADWDRHPRRPVNDRPAKRK
jgi:hypothetical protein